MSSALSPILELERRSRDYWNVDGLPAIAGGACYMLVGVIFLPDWSVSHPVISLLVGMGFFYTFGELAIHWLKARVTYPRTGYVNPPNPPSNPIEGHFLSIRDADTLDAQRHTEADRLRRKHLLRVAIAFAIVVTFSMMGAVIEDHDVFLKAAILCGLGFALKPSFCRITWFELVGCPVVAVLIVSLRGAPQHHALGLMFIGIGILFSLRGVLTLFRYLHNNPPLNG